MKRGKETSALRRLLPIVYVAGLFLVFNLPIRMEETASESHLDKIVHALLFLPLPILIIRSLQQRLSLYVYILLSILLSFGCAMATELQQTLNPYHTYDKYDLVADMFGASAGVIIYLLFFSSRPKR